MWHSCGVVLNVLPISRLCLFLHCCIHHAAFTHSAPSLPPSLPLQVHHGLVSMRAWKRIWCVCCFISCWCTRLSYLRWKEQLKMFLQFRDGWMLQIPLFHLLLTCLILFRAFFFHIHEFSRFFFMTMICKVHRHFPAECPCIAQQTIFQLCHCDVVYISERVSSQLINQNTPILCYLFTCHHTWLQAVPFRMPNFHPNPTFSPHHIVS
jgi:hypothetical protein